MYQAVHLVVDTVENWHLEVVAGVDLGHGEHAPISNLRSVF